MVCFIKAQFNPGTQFVCFMATSILAEIRWPDTNASLQFDCAVSMSTSHSITAIFCASLTFEGMPASLVRQPDRCPISVTEKASVAMIRD